MLTLEDTVRENLGSVKGEIADAAARCGRDPAGVTVMAVTKTHPVDHMLAAIRCGIEHIGENRVTEGAGR